MSSTSSYTPDLGVGDEHDQLVQQSNSEPAESITEHPHSLVPSHGSEYGLLPAVERQMTPGGSVDGVGTRHFPAQAGPGCCRRCLLKLRLYSVRGFALPQFLGLLGSLALPTADAFLDWSVLAKWYREGDMHWFEAGLAINLFSGALSGLMLGVNMASIRRRVEWGKWKVYLFGLLIGLPGLAPVVLTAFILYQQDVTNGLKDLKAFKGLELAFEALPQLFLQCVQSQCSCSSVK
jgi:hypothetical protein